MKREAFAFAKDFAAAPPAELRVDQHYLLCASRGALRLEARGSSWVLPPARAALIAAPWLALVALYVAVNVVCLATLGPAGLAAARSAAAPVAGRQREAGCPRSSTTTNDESR